MENQPSANPDWEAVILQEIDDASSHLDSANYEAAQSAAEKAVHYAALHMENFAGHTGPMVVLADKFYLLGFNLEKQGKNSDAARCYEQASKLFHVLPNLREKEADCLHGLGNALLKQENYADAAKRFEQAAQINHALPSRQDSEANALHSLRVAVQKRGGNDGYYAKAAEHYKQSGDIFQGLPTQEEIDAETHISFLLLRIQMLQNNKDFSAAQSQAEQAVLYAEQHIPGSSLHAMCVMFLGIAFDEQNLYEEAVQCFEQAYEISKQPGDFLIFLDTLAIKLAAYGRHEEIAEYYEQVAAIYPIPTDRTEGDARCLYNWGVFLGGQGKYVEAAKRYEQAAGIYRALPNRTEREALCFNNWGNAVKNQASEVSTFVLTGRVVQLLKEAVLHWIDAMKVYEAIEFEEIGRSSPIIALFSIYVLLTPHQKDDLSKGIKAFLEILPPNSTVRADFQMMRAEIFMRQGKSLGAEPLVQEAIGIYEANAPDTHGHAICLTQAGKIKRPSHTADAKSVLRQMEAKGHFDDAIRIVENLHAREQHGLLRTTDLFSLHLDAYRGMIGILRDESAAASDDKEKREKAGEAFKVAEKLRARSLVDNLEKKSLIAELGKATDNPEGQQLAADHERALAAYNEAHDKLQWLQVQPGTVWEQGRLRGETEAAKTELNRVETEAMERFGQRLKATRLEAHNLAQTQNNLDDRTLLLCYSWLGEYLYAWAIRKNAVLSDVPRIPAQAVEGAMTMLFGPATVGATEEGEDAPVAGELWKEPTGDCPLLTHEGQRAVEMLAEKLLYPLLPPNKPEIWQNVEQVVVVADGDLHRLPFEMLPLDEKHRFWNAPDENPVLGAALPVMYVPSATMLAVQQQAWRKTEADTPYFGVAASPDDQKALNVAKEVEAARRCFDAPEHAQMVNPDLIPGVRAAMLRGMTACKVAHLAGHTKHNASDPMASGLYLGTDLDSQKEHLLSGYDFLARSVKADVFCLAGCRTHAGQYVTGEGQIGLARCLLYAGANYAVVSLWNVDDGATLHFMSAFFKALAGGLAAPQAAHQARRVLANEWAEWHPVYQNAFVVVGSPQRLSHSTQGVTPLPTATNKPEITPGIIVPLVPTTAEPRKKWRLPFGNRRVN